MVDNIRSTEGAQFTAQETQIAAKDQLFPGADWSASDVNKAIGNWVNNIVQTIQNDQAQMKQAEEQLKQSEEGQS